MKKILFISICTMLLASCAVKYPYKRYSSAIDFSEVTRAGFFLSESNSVSFPYEPVGSVTAVVESGYEVVGQQKNQTPDEVYSYQDLAKMKFGKYKYATPEDAISELISSAQELGANGIINLKTTYGSAIYDKNGAIVSPSSYVVSGMAIKRK